MIRPELAIIDIHAHLGEYFEFPITGFDAQDVVNTARELGIAKMCVSHIYGLVYNAAGGNSMTLAAAAEFPEQLLACGVLDPRLTEQELAQEFERLDAAVAMWGELHPCLHRYPIDGPGFRVILELIRNNPKPVLFHTDQSDPYSQPGRLQQFIADFPEIPFLIGHSGNVIGGFEEAMQLAVQYENAFLDITFSRNYQGLMETMIRRAGAGKILFGSDMPFLSGSAQIGKLLCARIDDRDREMIMSENARKLLGLKE